jgi:pantothenate kinase-related protein Tda10
MGASICPFVIFVLANEQFVMPFLKKSNFPASYSFPFHQQRPGSSQYLVVDGWMVGVTNMNITVII